MADGPDLAALFAQHTANNQQRAAGASSPLLACILPGSGRDVDVGGSVSLKGKGILNGEGMINKLSQKPDGMLAKLLKGTGLNCIEIVEDIRKGAQGITIGGGGGGGHGLAGVAIEAPSMDGRV